MRDEVKLSHLVNMSHEIGNEIAYVQGGGGNTSVKLDESRMAIKASGIPLKDMAVNYGVSVVDYQKVNSYHDLPDESEDAYSESINQFALGDFGRPSIETGFHALLGNYVIHSHSVFLNVLLCAQEGKNIILEHFPDAIWVDYCTPGRNLTLAVKSALSGVEGAYEGLVFLESHGLIASAPSHMKCLELHSHCNEKIREAFNLAEFNILDDTTPLSPESFLFPDQVIYMSPEQLESRTSASIETIATVKYLESNMQILGLTAKHLSLRDVEILNNMQSEKYRKKVSK